MLSMFFNGATGYGMILAVLFHIRNIDNALNSATDHPFIQILVKVTGSIGDTMILASIIMIMQISATTSLSSLDLRFFVPQVLQF